MFNFNTISAEQPSVDPYRFKIEYYGQVSDNQEIFP